MTDQSTNKDLFQHILVAVDASAHTEAGLDAAFYLANHLGSRIEGLFIRSQELHHICRLTFLSEVSELTGEIRPLPEQFLEKQLSQAEKRIKQRVQFVEIRGHISCSSISVVGSVTEQILNEADNADLVVMSQTGRSLSRLTKLADTVHTVSKKSKKPVMVVKKKTNRKNVVISLYDGSEHSKKGFKTALKLAESIQQPLILLVLLNDSDTPQEVINLLKEAMEEAGIPIELSVFKNLGMWDLARTVNRFPSGFLVIPEDLPLGQDRKLEYLLDLVENHSLLLTN